MASTYSPALRLELMATGDQSGTWGDTTNTNLGTLLEQAITGYLSVAQGDVANLTLTTTNGASDQARNAVIRITGALTATRNVVIQTANKMYTIANDTTGGFSIVVKTSAGTGVSIPPGAMMNVYSDGTNAVMGQNYWSGSIGGAVYLDAGAAVGPNYDLFRDSTSPAASDILGRVTFNGRDSAANKQEYASIEATILDTTSTSEDGTLDLYATVAGTRTKLASVFGTGVGIADGTVSLPGLSFISDPDSGFYRIGVNNIGAAVNGAKVLDVATTGLAVTGALSSTTTTTASALIPSGASVPTNGMYLPAANTLGWAVNSAAEMQLTSTGLSPAANDGNALGVSGTAWADLFLATGGVINWNAGDVTITHSANSLAFAGATSGYTFDVPIAVASGGTGLATLTANNVILGNGTSNVQFVAPSTSGNVLTSNGTTWQSTAPAAAGGMTLLGTITTTSGASQSLTSLTLTDYLFVRLVFNGVSGSLATANLTCHGWTFVDFLGASAAGLAYGFIEFDLTAEVFSNTVYVTSSAAASNNNPTAGPSSGLTTASTSVTVAVSTGAFDAGSVSVYGIK